MQYATIEKFHSGLKKISISPIKEVPDSLTNKEFHTKTCCTYLTVYSSKSEIEEYRSEFIKSLKCLKKIKVNF